MSYSAQKWREELKNSGYETIDVSIKNMKKLLKSRTGKMIIKDCGLQPGENVLEVGCGGGRWLVPLSYMGCFVTGLDCSKEVLQRVSGYIKRAENIVGKKLSINLIEEDICNLKNAVKEQFDTIFSAGVMEHFLPEQERKIAYKNQINLLRKGGRFCVIVPNGDHWQRSKKETKLPGYHVPEIDYTEKQIKKELESLGIENIKIITYRTAILYESNSFLKLLQGITDFLLPRFFLPTFLRRKLGTYIFVVGEKPK